MQRPAFYGRPPFSIEGLLCNAYVLFLSNGGNNRSHEFRLSLYIHLPNTCRLMGKSRGRINRLFQIDVRSLARLAVMIPIEIGMALQVK